MYLKFQISLRCIGRPCDGEAAREGDRDKQIEPRGYYSGPYAGLSDSASMELRPDCLYNSQAFLLSVQG